MNDHSMPKTNEEPELGAEESVPLDGTDPVGEKMMEDLGRERKEGRAAAGGASAAEDDPGPLPEQLPVS